MLELATLNAKMTLNGAIRRETIDGREYLIAEATILKEGVLPGSNGPLFYPNAEITSHVGTWNNYPVTASHPKIDDKYVSASDPEAMARFAIGVTENDRIINSERRVDVRIDVGVANRVDGRIVPSVLRGDAVPVSTGLYSQQREADPTNNRHNGVTYTHTVHNIRPDHLAILMDEDGACSVRDGCGININAEQKSKLSEGEKSALFLYNRDWPKAKRDKAPKSTFAGPHESFPVETQTDVDAAAKLIGHADDPEAVKSRIKTIAKERGLTVPESWSKDGATTNTLTQEDLDSFFTEPIMNKAETVEWLTVNCDCWKGDAAKANLFLNTLDESILGKLKLNAEKATKLDLTINKLKTVAKAIGKPDSSLDDLLKTVTANAKTVSGKDANTTEEPDVPQKTRKSSGSQEGGDKRGAKKKDGFQGTYDEDNDDDEDDNDEEKPMKGKGKKMTKNAFLGILADHPGLKDYVVANGMPASAAKGTVRENGNDQLGNEDSGHGRGVETDVDQPMGGDVDEEGTSGKMAGKKGKKTMTKNSVLEVLQGLTEEEFLKVAPKGIQQTLNSAKEVVEKERMEIMKSLTANISSAADRKAKLLTLKDKGLQDLRELKAWVTLNAKTKVESEQSSEEAFLNNFFKSGGDTEDDTVLETAVGTRNAKATSVIDQTLADDGWTIG